jgi:hypothetical protein
MSKGWFVFWLILAATVILVCLVWLFSTKGSGCVPGYHGEC